MGVTLFQLENDFDFMVSTHVSVNRDYGSLIIMNKLSITNHNIQPETVSDYQTNTDRVCIVAMHNILQLYSPTNAGNLIASSYFEAVYIHY